MGYSDKRVIGILPSVQGAYEIKLSEENGGEQVIHSERIVRMPA